MVKTKLRRFEEAKTFPNFLQPEVEDVQKNFYLRGQWGKEFFKNDNPIVLEIGCGKGEFAVGLAKKYPEKNFVGIDRKGARIWRGAKTTHEENIDNVCFLRAPAEFLFFCFAPDEVSEIWIPFPDPHPKPKKENKRLTSPWFLDVYKRVLIPEGIIHLKTDNHFLYHFTLDVIRDNNHRLLLKTNDLYTLENSHEAAEILTFYEQKFLGKGIHVKYLEFCLKQR